MTDNVLTQNVLAEMRKELLQRASFSLEMSSWLVALVAAVSAAGVGAVAWAVGAGYDAWRRHHRAPVLDRLTKTWQPW